MVYYQPSAVWGSLSNHRIAQLLKAFRKGWRTVAFRQPPSCPRISGTRKDLLYYDLSRQFGIENRPVPGMGHAPAYICLGQESNRRKYACGAYPSRPDLK